MMGILIIAAAIVLIVLNPFHGAVVIGGVIVGLTALMMALVLAGAAFMVRSQKSMRDDFFGRHSKF